MNYIASIFDFFRTPKWGMTLLYGGLCALIPVVGPLVLVGWLISGFWARQDERCETFPPFEFSQFDKYLEYGAMPFVVGFLVGIGISVVAVPLLIAAMMVPVALSSLSSAGDSTSAGYFVGVAFILLALLFALVILAIMTLLMPLMLRATLTQDFAKSFDLRFMKRFLALTWRENMLTTLFTVVAGIGLACLGALALFIGMYFAGVVSYFSWAHLQKQLYFLYLTRGGDPVPLSSKLFDVARVPASAQ